MRSCGDCKHGLKNPDHYGNVVKWIKCAAPLPAWIEFYLNISKKDSWHFVKDDNGAWDYGEKCKLFEKKNGLSEKQRNGSLALDEIERKGCGHD